MKTKTGMPFEIQRDPLWIGGLGNKLCRMAETKSHTLPKIWAEIQLVYKVDLYDILLFWWSLHLLLNLNVFVRLPACTDPKKCKSKSLQ